MPPGPVRALEWRGDHLALLDQRLLPHQTEWLRLETWTSVHDAIRDMAVRGAPAIGVAAAYGLALAAIHQNNLITAREALAASRPTAVNLVWALDRVMSLQDRSFESILAEAQAIEREDLAMNLKLAEHGASLVPPGSRVLTICNTGSLATAGHGTALGIIRTAFAQGKVVHVYSCETRPRQQGLRLTAWELLQDGIPFQSVADSAAASLMAQGRIDFVVVGADRIAANGDTANKIGTLSLAVLAHHFDVPFYVAAPSSTLDPSLVDGSNIPIEERDPTEITEIEGVRVAPDGCPVWNPGFDVTPGSLVTAIVTEVGVFRAPYLFN
ncbi:MAG: S-methyl-5-thioribose-1-phosphate isomerase [Fimbriimonadaceae bacterium]|nr:S-methyl-5-thioribose-1-phosphate isomerase [Fimbriimonadaceae bacterium]QYK57496.1 MAG: S-methyl-5-thioribose-1-phosphate isomerase [Fimbriimonadaceae bacterium]